MKQKRLASVGSSHPVIDLDHYVPGYLTWIANTSVSRAFKLMHARGLITIGLDANDGRLRVATITAKGRQLHNRIMQVALERERALLSVFDPTEREVLIELLRRMHENLPSVEAATDRYLAEHFPKARRKAVLRREKA